MREFKSFLSPLIKDFIYYRKASNNWCDTYEKNLYYFDNHCFNNYPDSQQLSQEIVDTWCSKRKTENNKSCRTRTDVIVQFILYLNKRNISGVTIPIIPKFEKRTYIPYFFTEEELKNFFYACDTFCCKPMKSQHNRKLTVPVFFRLLYSSGLRTTEARLLKVADVDFEQGVLNINETKGHDQHFVVLDDDMLELMKRYHVAIEKHSPNRFYFFTPWRGDYYRKEWVEENFKEMWNKYNDNSTKVVPYDLRHHYAITNINSWIGMGFDFDDKLLYLSKSMGHRTLESTMYYFSLVPTMFEIIEEKSGDDFDDIIPEVYKYEED